MVQQIGLHTKSLRITVSWRKDKRMANENSLSWNFANWVTVALMAAIAFAVLGVVQKYMQSCVSGGS